MTMMKVIRRQGINICNFLGYNCQPRAV
jgi:hypothetical protein